MSELRNGVLRPTGWSVTCGICPESMSSDIDDMDNLMTDMKEHGWKFVRYVGWVCERCAKKMMP